MQIIPVIDLYKGVVVHAIEGNRNKYKAISSTLCLSSDPIDVITSLLTIFNFKSIYIADLDALEKQGEHTSTIETICNHFPDLVIWLDTGHTLLKHYLESSKYPNLRLILSSESLPSVNAFSSLKQQHVKHNFILSLDFKDDQLLGCPDILQNIQLWPNDVIVLNLNSVGSKRGVQFPGPLNQTVLTSRFNIYYGGGIRDLNDLKELQYLGCAGSLVSTALHNMKITAEDIKFVNQ